MKRNWAPFIILVSSAIVHFAYFGLPNQTVFDEVHFGKFASGYFTGEYFFDIHPPLGKLLISFVGYLTGFKPGFSFANIGETFPDWHYLILRLLPTLAGFLLPFVIYKLARELKLSNTVSLTAALLVIFENALTVQSRFILLDSFLLLFGFSALWFYLAHRRIWESGRKKSAFAYLVAAGIMGSLAVSIKWTGASFLALIIIFEITRWFLKITSGITGIFTKENIKNFAASFICLVLLPVAIYASIFAAHFALLPKSGPGDAFMSPEFKKTLLNNPDHENEQIKKISWLGKFSELNIQMFKANQRLNASHPYGSKWYTWPFLIRPIYYWNLSVKQGDQIDNTGERKIYLLGNPFVWWSSTVAIILLLAQTLKNLIKKREVDFIARFLLLGYVLNLLPFIGVTRVMFLYHYFIPLIFAVLSLAYLLEQNYRKKYLVFFAVLAIATFWFFAPLTYGLPLTPAEQSYLFWLPSWR